ncbi:hypothetical protein BDB01DRAFT_451256 [Pilobolus umbonatus]|nr:hypothetical protein BDB01DRAFT_451256 [Pilobolus umbonatus]
MHFHLQDSYYIKNRFTCLKDLTIHISNKVYDEEWSVGLLMEMTQLNRLLFKMETKEIGQYQNVVRTFWKYAEHHETDGSVNRAEIASQYEDRMLVALSYTKIGKKFKTMAVKLCIPHLVNVSYKDWIGDFGYSINELRIKSYHPGSKVNMKEINNLCPSLVRLDLIVSEIISSDSFYSPNHHLSDLTLNFCPVDNNTLREIESVYPRLKNLYLVCVDLKYEYSADNIYYLQLPETGLLYLELRGNDSWLFEMNFKVVMEVNGYPRYRWRLNLFYNETIVNTYEDSITESLSRPQHILKSSTVQDVLLQRL